jgi:hypothetical protein
MTVDRRGFLRGAGAFVALAAAGAAADTARGSSLSLKGLRDAVGGTVFTPGQAGYPA